MIDMPDKSVTSQRWATAALGASATKRQQETPPYGDGDRPGPLRNLNLAARKIKAENCPWNLIDFLLVAQNVCDYKDLG